jgi:fructose-bisphosphate aldolase class II
MLLNMRDLLAVARAHTFAVPAFNISTNMLLRTVLEASEEKQAPVILAIHPLELDFARPSFVKMVLDEANRASIPVVVHLDHGSSLAQIMGAIQLGFTSVMIDASHEPLEQNIAISRTMVELAHAVNVSVEGELGTIGSTGSYAEAGADEIIYTNPEDAATYVAATGIDTLAVAIGTRHGIYPKHLKPELKLDLLREIRTRVEAPLVLHGGSANPDDEIAAAVALGINKINISSDVKNAYYRTAREVLLDEGMLEPFMIYPRCMEAAKEVAKQKIDLFRTAGKAPLYRAA